MCVSGVRYGGGICVSCRCQLWCQLWVSVVVSAHLGWGWYMKGGKREKVARLGSGERRVFYFEKLPRLPGC